MVGIYGANASGKSNLLKALGFMRSAVLDSHQKWPSDGGILIPHFALDPAFRDVDSLLEVNVRIDSVRYQYGFRMNSAAVSAEWLYACPGSRRQIGDTMLVDELDASMHPQLTAEIVTIFQNPATNPRHAQLIFTTHDTSLLGALLGDRELGREQVWFTEKRNDGSTVIYPLTDFSPRKAENLERGYLQGRHGAAPVLLEPLLARVPPPPAEAVGGREEGEE